LASQPGPEVFHQVVSYARSLNKKTQQMKAMASELNMLHVIVCFVLFCFCLISISNVLTMYYDDFI